jgi:hypothetical protein
MRNALSFVMFGLLAVGLPAGAAAGAAPAAQTANRVVDRIAARVEDDIVTLSEMRELAAYQELVEGRAEPDERLIQELIEQWAIRNETQAAQFPQPAPADVDRQVQQLEARFPTPEDYAQRLSGLGLTPAALRGIVTQQIYLTSYLDYRFRPAVDVTDEAIAGYYSETLAPALAAKQQTAPPLEAVTAQIREVLISKAVSERVAAWLDETKSRLRIEIEPAARAGGDVRP